MGEEPFLQVVASILHLLKFLYIDFPSGSDSKTSAYNCDDFCLIYESYTCIDT